ncbi:hypothetical protein BTUL_0131g00030 [Botrytis tulipae]|uniref:Uncharacterized protein n=1 Tax=Botrytis tulipae TaxID=87230 RepID=A0A4Z1EDW1_9HELO|nr:hypothetical protein BTUL_0131g00030 [Botrytis tulipae]
MAENLENDPPNRDGYIQAQQNIQTSGIAQTDDSSPRSAFSQFEITQTTDNRNQIQVPAQSSQEDSPPDRGRTLEQQRPLRRRMSTRFLVPTEILVHIEHRGLDFRKLWPDPDPNMPQHIIDATHGFDMKLAMRLLDHSERLCDIYMSQLNVIDIAIPYYSEYANSPPSNAPSPAWRNNLRTAMLIRVVRARIRKKTGRWRDALMGDGDDGGSQEYQALRSMMNEMKNWN